MRKAQNEEISESLTEALRRIKAGESLEKGNFQEIERKISEIGDPLLREHLTTLIEEIKRGELDEGDFLSKALSHGTSELSEFLKSMLEYSYEDPFSELEIRSIIDFWISTLRELTKGRKRSATS